MLKVVWDNGNGAAGEVLQRLVAGLPGEHIVLNGTIDGQFPAHHPDPTVPKNLRAADRRGRGAPRRYRHRLRRRRRPHRRGRRQRADILFGDQLMVLLARDVLRAHPGATIIADVKASQVLFDEIARAGGNPLMWKTGHSLIKAKMAETGSPLAGEMSGHIFFADRWYGFDDALYAAVRMLGIVARLDGKLSAVRDALPQVINTPELRFDCDDTRKFARDRGSRGTAACGRRESVRDRRRARADRRWLVAAARVQYAGGAGGARGGRHRGWTRAAEAGAGEATRTIRPAGAGLFRQPRGALTLSYADVDRAPR